MCYTDDARPPLPPISGAAADHGETTLTASDGNQLAAYFARAEKPTGAGMVVLPDVRGLHEFYKELAQRFAEAGVDSVAIDYFGRTAGIGDRSDSFEYMPHVQQTTPEGVASDTAAAIAYLRSKDGGAVKFVFTIGFCFGGSNSWNQSAEQPDIGGCIGFYGRPVRSEPFISKMKAPLPAPVSADLERRRAGLARHMARAVVAVVRWDDSTGVPPQQEAIAKTCEAGLDLFLATAREARPAAPEELRRVAQLGILQARSSQSVEPILAAYRIAARVAWDAILRAWRGHPEVTPEALMVTANYVFAALDQVAAEVTKTYLHAREQHMHRGTRARARLVHALISDSFDSELELQKQALTLNMPITASGYIAVVCMLIIGSREGARGGDSLAEVVSSLEL